MLNNDLQLFIIVFRKGIIERMVFNIPELILHVEQALNR